MIFSIGTTDLSWGNLMLAGNREPLESRLTNLSYTDFLWELNQMKGEPSAASYTAGNNGGGFGNYYVGLITSVPYVRDGKKTATKGSHNQGADNESIAMKGPWYVSYCGLDTMYKTTGNGKYDFHPDGDGNTYYADRIVLKQEMDYALDKNYVNKYQLGTYYTGVGLWWDSWNTINGGARNYRDLKEVPDGTYFTSTSYSEIFNDYTYNKATGNYAHAEGYHTYVVSSNNAHGEGKTTIITGSENAHAEGLSTVIDNAHEAHVEGSSTKAFNGAYAAHAEGTGSYVKGVNAHAENSSYANGKNSHAGGEAIANGTNSFAHGIKNTLASGTNSVALSSGTASGENSVAISGGQATTKNSIAIGVGAKANTNEGAVALGNGTSTGTDSFSANIGESSGTRSVAINNATASGANSLASGISSASGVNSVAINASSAISQDAFSANKGKALKYRATGLNSAMATGIDAFAANTSTAGGTNSASIGNGNASGDVSFASGFGKANGKGSHAEGNSSTSVGTYSHAEGNNTSATGQYAHTEGNYTKTTNDYEHAQGTFNQSYTGSDTQSASLFEIGDGTADNARHNVVSIFRNGNFFVDSKNNAYLNAANEFSIHGRKTLNVTSPDIKLNTDRLHLHANKYVCVRADEITYLKGSSITYIGRDQEGSLTSNAYVLGNKKTEYITGDLVETTTGFTTTHRVGAVKINNDSTVTETTTGEITEKFTKGRSTTVSEGNSLTVNGLQSENYNTERQAYVSGGCYMYVSQEIGAYIGQGSTTRINGKNTTSIGTGNSLTINGGNSVDITGTNNIKVTGDDNLTVTSSKTDKITNNYIIQDTGTYIISPHVTIGQNNNNSSGNYSTTIGNNNQVTSQYGVAIGDGNNNSGVSSVLLGTGLLSGQTSKVSVGKYNHSYSEGIFEVGIGTSNTDRKNAFTCYGTGETYFHYQPYVYDSYINSVTYGNGIYKSTEYPDQSVAVSMSYYNLSYKGLYDTVSRKFSTIGSLSSVKSIDSISRTTTTNTLHYTKHNYNTSTNKYDSNTYTITQDSATESLAGLMSAQDKTRLDSIWEGDKTIALMNFDTTSCKWTVYKNDGTTSYTGVVHMSSSNTTTSQSLNIEYGFKAKWTGSWKWISGSNYKNAERCTGSISETTLPAANTYSTVYNSPIKDYSTRGTILSQTIYAAKRGLIIDGYPDSAGASNNGTVHSGRIRPASGEDSRSLSVSLGYYYLFFSGAMNVIPSDMSKIKGLSTKTCINKNVTCQYTTTTSNPYFVFAYPSGFGDVSTIKKNGVEIITTSFLKVGAFDYVNGAGVTIKYNVYRTGAGVANMQITIS